MQQNFTKKNVLLRGYLCLYNYYPLLEVFLILHIEKNTACSFCSEFVSIFPLEFEKVFAHFLRKLAHLCSAQIPHF